MKAFVRLCIWALALIATSALAASGRPLSASDSALVARIILMKHPGQPGREIQIRRLICIQPVSFTLRSGELAATRCSWHDGDAAVDLPTSEEAVSLFHLLKNNNAMNKSNSGASVYVGPVVTCMFANAGDPRSARCNLF